MIDLYSLGIPEDTTRDITIKPVKIELPAQEEEKKEGCVQATCLPRVKCSNQYFEVKNLFSELTDDYQRAIIRQNLGISDGSSIVWGKIEGNLANQKDLSKFIIDILRTDESGIIDQMNLELKYWTQHIENKIESLASNITSFEIVPRYGTTNNLPVSVAVTWQYDQEVEAQAINGIVLDPSERSYIFTDVNDTLHIRLSYFYNNVWLARNITFEVSFPIFYGVSDNPEENNYTIKNKFTVTANESQFIYVMSKNKINLSVNGIIGGFEDAGIAYISNIRYYIYRSANSNLGETTIIINDKE